MTSTASSTADHLRVVGAALDAIAADDRTLAGHRERLDNISLTRKLVSRIEALLAVQVHEAEVANSARIATGSELGEFLKVDAPALAAQAAGLKYAGADLARDPDLQRAALAGVVDTRQGRAMVSVLDELPSGLDADARGRAKEILLGQTGVPAREIEKLGPQVLAAVTPVNGADARRAEIDKAVARRRSALRRRSFMVTDARDGSWVINGVLPDLEAHRLVKLLDAFEAADKRVAREHPDRSPEGRSWGQRRADALIALVDTAEHGGAVPVAGGERPRLVVTMNAHDLAAQLEQVGLLPNGGTVTPGVLRRIACDAGILPVLLGAASEVLDVGRERRLVTKELRRALSIRDKGCVFPHCGVPAEGCEAHHVIPWWQDGATSQQNLVLLCAHHHGILEPDRMHPVGPNPGRWEIRASEVEGRFEILPPVGLDPKRSPQPARHGHGPIRIPDAAETQPSLVGGPGAGDADGDGMDNGP